MTVATDEVRSDESPDEGDATPAAESETIPSEGSESAESGCEDSNDQVAAGEQAETDDTEEVEEVDELPAAEAAAIVSEIVPAVVDETVQEPPEGETLEPAPVDAEADLAWRQDRWHTNQAAGAMNVPSEQQPPSRKSRRLPRRRSRQAKRLSRRSKTKPAKRGIPRRRRSRPPAGESKARSEELVAEGTEKSEASNETGVGAEDPSAEKSEKHKSGKREKKYLGETVIEVGWRSGASRYPAGVRECRQPSIEQPRMETTESRSAPVAETASTADPGTTTSSSPRERSRSTGQRPARRLRTPP